ncbi:RNA methyltransferase [Paracoccus sp. p4-l81]|uniref:RNA methyltransferase n=1 Tax=unclassified Paracoccus (in: a-proteobacteria) TaxID=2688777 RepID=UPI0035B6ECEC
MEQPVFILTRPQMGENIGAAARAMLNFGLDRLRLIAPRDGWPNPAAIANASGAASRVLDPAGVFPDMASAIGDCQMVFATTARPRELTKPVYTPEAAVAEARRLIAGGAKVGFVFGPERAGLENTDLALASAIVSVPVNPAFASLNLGQAVLLMAYEWGRQTIAAEPITLRGDVTELATRIEVDRLADHYEERLDQAGFFFPPGKAAVMRQNLRAFWARMPLTRADVQTLHGALRQLLRQR